MKGNNLQPNAESCSKKTFVRTHLTTLCPTKNLVQLIARHNPHASSPGLHLHTHYDRRFERLDRDFFFPDTPSLRIRSNVSWSNFDGVGPNSLKSHGTYLRTDNGIARPYFFQ